MWLAATNGFSLGWDSLQPEAPPERGRVASQAPALSPQQPPRQRAGCERIAVVLVHARSVGLAGPWLVRSRGRVVWWSPVLVLSHRLE